MSKPGKTVPTPDRLMTIQDVADRCQVAGKFVRASRKGARGERPQRGRQVA